MPAGVGRDRTVVIQTPGLQSHEETGPDALLVH